MFNKALILALTLTPIIAYSACELDKLEITDTHVLGGLPGQKNTAGYAKIKNNGKEACHLKAASSSIAGRVELHTIEHKGTMMKMVQVDQFDIPAGGELSLKNGGNHLMFIGVNKTLNPGEKVDVELMFDDNQKKTEKFTVENMKK